MNRSAQFPARAPTAEAAVATQNLRSARAGLLSGACATIVVLPEGVELLNERLAALERQVAELLRGDVPVAARADGSLVVTADSTPVGRAIRLVLSELRREVPYDSCSVQELRESRLVIIGGVGFADLDVILGESFAIDNVDIPNSEVIYRRRPVVVSDTDQYRAFRRGLHVGAGILSWLGVPMVYGDRLLGMIALDKAEPNFYTAIHAQHALAFASLVGWAIAASEARAAEA